MKEDDPDPIESLQAASRAFGGIPDRALPKRPSARRARPRFPVQCWRTEPPVPPDRSGAAAALVPSSRRHRPACAHAANQLKRAVSAPELSPAALDLRTWDTVPWLPRSPSRSGTQQSGATARAPTHHRYTAPHASPSHVTRRSNRLTSFEGSAMSRPTTRSAIGASRPTTTGDKRHGTL